MTDSSLRHIRVCAAIRRRPDDLLVVSEQFRGEERINLPGGAPNYGETLETAVLREVREETGYEIILGEIAFVAEHRSHRWEDTVIEVCFYAELTTASANPARSEVTAAYWLPLDDPKLIASIPGVVNFANSKRGRYFNDEQPGIIH